jgi:lysophospholipid acyltransferase (LPLAT)-like uncharacterized protein
MAKIRLPTPVIGWMLSRVIKLMSLTVRVRLIDPSGVVASQRAQGGPVLWLTWHQHILSCVLYQWQWLYPRITGVLTSASQDGDLLADVCGRFGMIAARGSSSRKQTQALRESLQVLRQGRNLCITPDGPRGPRHEIKPGILHLAKKTGIPLIILRYRYRSAWQLKTWDHFYIPKPFSSVDLVIDPPVHLPAHLTEEEMEQKRLELQARMLSDSDE